MQPEELKKKYDSDKDTMTLPAKFIPGFRSDEAIQNGVERNLLFKTWGGIGDQICAEPTLRYAFKEFKDCQISLASEIPELFRHLPWKKIYNLEESQPYWKRYFVFDTIVSPKHLLWQFVSHCITNCVDFPSICALRCQLPIKDREIHLAPKEPSGTIPYWDNDKAVFIHAGKHWASKTFPKDWWDAVINLLVDAGLIPVLIGADADDNRSTVDVDASRCVDLRNKLSINDSIWYVQRAKVLLTNDSAPLHMAASKNPDDLETGKTWIGFVATCKHPDYISHWRNGQWSWREENLGLGGMWDIIDNCPNKGEEVTVEFVDEDLLRSWLPEPKKVVEWTLSKIS